MLVAASTAVAILILVAVLLNSVRPTVALEVIEGRRTWIVWGAEEDRVELLDEVRPDDALVCIREGLPDKSVNRLVDLYLKGGSEIWIEGERIENPPPGPPPKRGVFDRDPMGPVYIYCGDPKF
jgi:hypothetical protein